MISLSKLWWLTKCFFLNRCPIHDTPLTKTWTHSGPLTCWLCNRVAEGKRDPDWWVRKWSGPALYKYLDLEDLIEHLYGKPVNLIDSSRSRY